MRALVVGGGITGTATANRPRAGGRGDGARRAQPGWHALGSGITMIGPALRALDRLGLLDDCLAEGFGATELTIADTDGVVRTRIPRGAAGMLRRGEGRS